MRAVRHAGGMELFLSHDSALSYWRNARCSGFVPQGAPWVPFVVEAPTRQIEIFELLLRLREFGIVPPVHILVGRAQRNRSLPGFVIHATEMPFGNQAFVAVDSAAAVSCPEFCYLQMASRQSPAGEIRLGFELCGTYAQQARENGNAVFQLPPLTSQRRLLACADALPGWKGVGVMRRALRFVRPNAASPMEAALCMLLCLPHALGGYGLPMPQMNYAVTVESQRLGGVRERRCDLFWPEFRLGVEYDSDAYHALREKLHADAARRVDLGLNDIDVVSVTIEQLRDARALEDVARLLAGKMGKRIHPLVLAPSETRANLRRQLLT